MSLLSMRKWHRWLGLGLGWLMFVWFVSGAVMIFVHLPGAYKTPQGRAAAGPALAAGQVKINPARAWASAGSPAPLAEARLSLVAGRPAWLFRSPKGRPRVVWADSGQLLAKVDPGLARAAARLAAGPQATLRHRGLVELDQWTVGAGSRPWQRPFHQFAAGGGKEIYVSAQTGEVCQVTTTGGRFRAWLGAIPHWLYFTAIRQHLAVWRWGIVALAGLGCLLCVSGLWLGVKYFRPGGVGRGRRKRKSIYLGARRWHHYLGLAFGLPALAFTFSGGMSLHPFDWLGSPPQGRALARELSGGPPRPDLCQLSAGEAIAALAPLMETRLLRLVSFQGRPYYLALNGRGDSRLVPADRERPLVLAGLSQAELRRACQGLCPGGKLKQAAMLPRGDLYLPRWDQPVFKAVFDDPGQTWLYIDPARATVVRSLDGRGRLNRWLYNFLHCLDLPWLVRHGPWRESILLALMAGGAALCISGPWAWLARRRSKREGDHS